MLNDKCLQMQSISPKRSKTEHKHTHIHTRPMKTMMHRNRQLMMILWSLLLSLSAIPCAMALTPEQEATANQMRNRRDELQGMASDLEQQLTDYWNLMEAYSQMGDAIAQVSEDGQFALTGAEIASLMEANYQSFLANINTQYSAIASEASDITNDLIEMGAELIFTPADPTPPLQKNPLRHQRNPLHPSQHLRLGKFRSS